jgi:hypothetical protein
LTSKEVEEKSWGRTKETEQVFWGAGGGSFGQKVAMSKWEQMNLRNPVQRVSQGGFGGDVEEEYKGKTER